MADERYPSARRMLLEVLLEKVTTDPFPSIAMLDLIEELLRPDEVPIYVALLLRRIEEEPYPSIPTLRRLVAIAT